MDEGADLLGGGVILGKFNKVSSNSHCIILILDNI